MFEIMMLNKDSQVKTRLLSGSEKFAVVVTGPEWESSLLADEISKRFNCYTELKKKLDEYEKRCENLIKAVKVLHSEVNDREGVVSFLSYKVSELNIKMSELNAELKQAKTLHYSEDDDWSE